MPSYRFEVEDERGTWAEVHVSGGNASQAREQVHLWLLLIEAPLVGAFDVRLVAASCE